MASKMLKALLEKKSGAVFGAMADFFELWMLRNADRKDAFRAYVAGEFESIASYAKEAAHKINKE